MLEVSVLGASGPDGMDILQKLRALHHGGKHIHLTQELVVLKKLQRKMEQLQFWMPSPVNEMIQKINDIYKQHIGCYFTSALQLPIRVWSPLTGNIKGREFQEI